MSTEYFRLDTTHVTKETPFGLRWRTQLLVFCIAVLAVISRRPDALLHPQFFAEDGMFWYADAYNLGWLHALFISHTGYFQTLPRLSAALSLLVPLRWAPLALNLIAIAIQVFPVTLLLSGRLSRLGDLNLRMFMAAVYLALPNSRELDAAITEAQWHMALFAALVVLAVPSRRKVWLAFDVAVMLLCGLTGPFCLVLLPVACAVWWKRRDLWHVVLAFLLAACSAIQLHALITTAEATRSQETLGANAVLFVRMLIGDVYLGALLGQNHLASRSSIGLLLVAGVLGTSIVVYCLLRASLELKLFVLYSFALYAASLHNPMISDNQPQWPVLADAPGLRYWFFPMLAFVWSVLWCAAQQRSRPMRIIGGGAAFLLIFGVMRDWEYPAFSNHSFPEYARRFDSLPSGRAMVFPLYPDGWTMQLVKKGAQSCEDLPTGFLDTPKDHARVSASVPVVGWVNALDPVEEISIFVDGNVALSLKPDKPRPDVDRKFPGGAVKDKGWEGNLDLSKMGPGTHSIEAQAKLRNGCEGVIGIATVETGR